LEVGKSERQKDLLHKRRKGKSLNDDCALSELNQTLPSRLVLKTRPTRNKEELSISLEGKVVLNKPFLLYLQQMLSRHKLNFLLLSASKFSYL
jgi:hypothetical protein